MRSLGLLLVVGALGYYYLMTPATISKLTAPAPPQSAQSIQQEAKDNKEATEQEQAASGDHLFEGLTG